jgi:hypothetical protein
VKRFVDKVLAIQPPKAKPDLTMVPEVGRVRFCPKRYVAEVTPPVGKPESAPFRL